MRRPTVFSGQRVGLFVRLIANGLAQVATVLASGLLASQLVLPSAGQRLWPIMAQLAGCAALLFGLRWLERVDAARLAQSYVHELRVRIFARLWHAHARETLRRGRGALLLRLMSDMGAIGRWIGHGLARIVVTAVVVVGVCAALLWLSPWLAAVALCLVAISGAAAFMTRRPLDSAVRAARAARGRLATATTDRLLALSAIQASGAWRNEQVRIERRSRAVRDATVAEMGWTASLLAASEMIGLLAPSLAIVAVILLDGAAMSLQTAPPVVALFGLIVTPLRDSMRVFDYWRKARIGYEKVDQMLSLARLPRPRVSPPLAVGRIDDIAIEGVPIADGGPMLDLRARFGERIQLHGVSGNAKTDLLHMLVRLIDPPQGRVVVNGLDLRDVDLGDLRARIALVSASLGLKRGRLRHLLTLRRPRASAEQITAVLQRCLLTELVARLPRGLDTRLEEGWPELPVAKRVRLLLAQALLSEPDVLLLDDVDGTVPPARLQELLSMLVDFRGIVVLVSNETCWRSWATQIWSTDRPTSARTDSLTPAHRVGRARS